MAAISRMAIRSTFPGRPIRSCPTACAGMTLARAQYGAAIDKTGVPGTQGGPLVHIMAAKAVCFLEALRPEFATYAKQVVSNAAVLADGLSEEGFRVVSGGTDTHLL